MTTVDIRPRFAGCVNIIRSAPNGSWIEVELLVQGPRGGLKKHAFRLDLFAACEIAQKAQHAIDAQKKHLERLQQMANGTGW